MTDDLSRRQAMLVAAGGMAMLSSAGLAQRGDSAASPAPLPPPGDAKAAWDLTDLYSSDTAWEAERQGIQARLPGLARWKGRLGESAETLRAALAAQSAVGVKVARLATYADLAADADLRNAPNQERRGAATDLAAAFAEATAWTAPELIQVGSARIDGFLRADPALAPFRFQLTDTLRLAPHTLSPEGEALLAAAGAPLAGPADIRNQLNASDLPYPTITLSTGSKARLDPQGYALHRDAPVRADRKQVMDAFFAANHQFQSTFGTALASQVKGEMFGAKARRYPSALAAALAGGNLPEGVYRTLVAETNAGLPVLHRYFDLRRRMLKLPDIAYYDIYPPLVSLDRSFPLDEMRRLTIEAVKPLGPEYGALFADVTARRWMDPRPRPGKASGAYMNPGAYEVHPYLLLNLSDKYDGLTTYAHEWGHAMHTLLANKVQPYETSNYPTFIAEIASTAHEALLARHMLAEARTREEKLFYLGQMMESFRSTFFRQSMFAEFQLAIHDLAEKGQGLSGERMSAVYLDLLRRYHSPPMTIDPAYAIEWAIIPHFFYGFYVFQYATSITASTFFVDRVLKGGPAERDTYLNVLRAGGSDYGYDILKRAGLDMASLTPYRTLIATFAAVLDQAEALLG